MAAVGAVCLAAYAMADVAAAAAQTAPKAAAEETDALQEPAADSPSGADGTEWEDNSAVPAEDTPYEELSEDALAALAEENIPSAGYAVYPAETVSAMLLAAAEGENEGEGETGGSTAQSWETLVEIPTSETNYITVFDASYSSDLLEGSDTPTYIERDKNFSIKYTVTLNTAKEIAPGNAVIRIPSTLFKLREGSTEDTVHIRDTDGIALPKYDSNLTRNPDGTDPLYNLSTVTKSNRTQFGYYKEKIGEVEYYVIVNYDTVKPGSTWFEVVYDQIHVFDVKDEQPWTIDPTIEVQYAGEKERRVFTGYPDPLGTADGTLNPIKLDYSEYLPENPDWDQTQVVTDSLGNVYYYDYDTDFDANDLNDLYNESFLPYYVKGNSQPKYLRGQHQGLWLKWDEDAYEWVPLTSGEEPVAAWARATICENDFVYIVTAGESADGIHAPTVYTYYDKDGNPKYQRQEIDGESKYYRISEDGESWTEDSEVKNELPAAVPYYYIAKPAEQDLPVLTGKVDTEAHLKTVTKEPGKVTDKVTGNLNSESQMLSFVPKAAQSQITGIDMEKNIYVLWEVNISGDNCTQPFNLYLDEATYFMSRQNGIERTYYDETTGHIVTETENTNVASDDGARIVYVAAADGPVSLDETDLGELPDGTATYTTIEHSDGVWYIGSSDPTVATSGLNNVRSTGRYSKKVIVIAEYPRGNDGEAGGVCVETLKEANNGKLVCVPYGAIMEGKDGAIYNIWERVNQKLTAAGEVSFPAAHDILTDRQYVKAVLEEVLGQELDVTQTDSVSPLLESYISELVENLPQTDDLYEILKDFDAEGVRDYIISALKANPPTDDKQLQIKTACEKYMDDILDAHLDKLEFKVNGALTKLKSYNMTKVYRDVKNDANVIMQPLDGKDTDELKDASAIHQRTDAIPSVPNGFTVNKKAQGGKKGWIDFYDASDNALFDSTFSFVISSSSTTFSATHPSEFGYFYDNQSFVKLVTADDYLTAQPLGTAQDGSNLYGRSYVLDENDYCYTFAKIIVNERVYNITDDTSVYGAQELTENAAINNLQPAAGETKIEDRDWHIYVSYETVDGKPVWVPYMKDGKEVVIRMEDYLAESPSDYSNDAAGANVLLLDFSSDDKQPCRIKVEHNTIDYQSNVSMNLTAAIKTDSPKLRKFGAIRHEVFQKSNNNAFNSEEDAAEMFRMRLTNYMGLYAQKYSITSGGSEDEPVYTPVAGETLIQDTPKTYDVWEDAAVRANDQINNADTLVNKAEGGSGNKIVPALPETFGGSAAPNTVKRMSASVDVAKLEKESLAEKTSTFSNDLAHGRAHITYRIAGYEGYLLDGSYKDSLDTLSSYGNLPGKDRRTIYIYDLLPPGVEYEGFSGGNEKPVAGFLTQKASITNPSGWLISDDLKVSAKVFSETDPEWASWGGAANGNGRYLVRFTITLPEDAEQYAVTNGGNWFFGVGVQFTANVSWERYSAAKKTPNLAVYVTDGETIGKQGTASQQSGVHKDDGSDAPTGYEPFSNSENDPNKTNFDCNPATGTGTYNRMYAKSMELGDIARASSTAVGKQVRADADTYALYSECTAVIKGEGYTYNINVENQEGGGVSSVILYDVIEGKLSGPDLWKGTLQAIDTSMLLLNNIYPRIYIYNDAVTDADYDADGHLKLIPTVVPQQFTYDGTTYYTPTLPGQDAWEQKGWKYYNASLADAPSLSGVTVVAIELYADSGCTEPYSLNGKEALSYKLKMKAPTDANLSQVKYAVNRPNYCYCKVERNPQDTNAWIVDDTEVRDGVVKYYDDEGNRTVVTLGERRMLKVAKHVESNYTNTGDMLNELEFTFRLERYIGVPDENGDRGVQKVPCANIAYQIYPCTFDDRQIERIDTTREIDAGVIHTTNENGEFVLHDGECAVFRYVPASAGIVNGETDKCDFDNYVVTELSKPFWYEFKSIDQSDADTWYTGGDPNGGGRVVFRDGTHPLFIETTGGQARLTEADNQLEWTDGMTLLKADDTSADRGTAAVGALLHDATGQTYIVWSRGKETDTVVLARTPWTANVTLYDSENAAADPEKAEVGDLLHTGSQEYKVWAIAENGTPMLAKSRLWLDDNEVLYEDETQHKEITRASVLSGEYFYGAGSGVHYRQTGLTVTNTYRPVIYISKDTTAVPADLPSPGATAAETAERQRKFNTFDYELEIYEYPINRMTGSYFADDEGYSADADSDDDGIVTLDGGGTAKANWKKLAEYYESYNARLALADDKLAAIQAQINTEMVASTPDAEAIGKLNRKKDAWNNLKAAMIADQVVLAAQVKHAAVEGKAFFAPPKVEVGEEWGGNGVLMQTNAGNLIMPISGFSNAPADATYKRFSNSISETDPRKDGDRLYVYTVGSTADIYETPDGWDEWEQEGQSGTEHVAASNPFKLTVQAGSVAAVPIYIEGGMMFSDYGLTDPGKWAVADDLEQATYTARYCYRFREDMDDKYWDDVAGEYQTVPDDQYGNPDLNERSWHVQTPEDNEIIRNHLGVRDENIMSYKNNYRFKDIYLQKTVEPADHVPKLKDGDTNAVETTAFVYQVLRRNDSAEGAVFGKLTEAQYKRMSWELWTRDANGKLLKKVMVGGVNANGTLLAPVANYTDAAPLYTVKIRNAEVGYTYEVREVMSLSELFDSKEPTAADRKAALEAAFPYVTYDAAKGTFTYKYDSTQQTFDGETNAVFYPADSTAVRTQEYTVATEELYALSSADTSGSLKTDDFEPISAMFAKVDMSIDNVYKLRSLSVTKSIIAETIDNDMRFTVRVRRKDGKEFQPKRVVFYRMKNGVRENLTQEEINALQQVTSGDFAPQVKYNAADGYYYTDFCLQNGVYAELVDIGSEFDDFQISEQDWDSAESSYVHIDPAPGTGGWSAWKDAKLGDNTLARIQNGDKGYMILTKTYVAESSGSYDDDAREKLTSNPVTLTFGLRSKGEANFTVPADLPEDSRFVLVNGVPVTDLHSIQVRDGENVIINLKALCEHLGLTYENVEYCVTEDIPAELQQFAGTKTDAVYIVEQLTPDEDMQGDSTKPSVEVQNSVIKCDNIIYKRLGSKPGSTPQKPTGKLILQLYDGSGNNRQAGVHYVATGDRYDADTAQSGTTEDTGGFVINGGYDGWVHPEDGNQTYFLKIYFNRSVLANLVRSDNDQVLGIREDMLHSDDSWGYLVGYETYGDAEHYVSETLLTAQAQWQRRADTIVNTVETTTPRSLEVAKTVKGSGRFGVLTAEDRNTEFTYAVRQFVNGVYEAAPGISYTVYDENGEVATVDNGDGTVTRLEDLKTNEHGEFKLRHGQTARLTLPQFSYWEVVETGKGDYRLLVDDNGEIVYDQGTQYMLDRGLDGLAPNETAAENYGATRTMSGFRLHTNFDIQSGIPIGDAVVLRRGFWDSVAQNDGVFVLYKNEYDDVSDETYYSTATDAALYYNNNKSPGTFTPTASTKITAAMVRGGVMYADLKMTQPVWYDVSDSTIPQTVKDKTQAFWNGNVDIPPYIYYYDADGMLYKHPVVGIARWAFDISDASNNKITSVTIPGTVQKIGEKAFYYCSALTSVNFASDDESSLLSIGKSAFQKTKVVRFHLPEGLTELGRYALWTDNVSNPDLLMPSTLTHCSVEAFSNNNKTAGGIVELNSGLNNSEGMLGNGLIYKSYFILNYDNGTLSETNPDIYAKPGSILRSRVLIMNHINEIRNGFFTDRSELLRQTAVFVFPDDPEGGHFIANDGMVVRTSFNQKSGGIPHQMIIWRSSVVGDSEHQGVIFDHIDNNNAYDDFGLENADNAMTLVFAGIESTNAEQVALIKQRFELTYDSATKQWYYDTKLYKSNKVHQMKIRVLFKDDIENLTAAQVLSEAGVAAYDINGRVTEILNDIGCKPAATGRPPYSEPKTFLSYLTEALWLNEKRRKS